MAHVQTVIVKLKEFNKGHRHILLYCDKNVFHYEMQHNRVLCFGLCILMMYIAHCNVIFLRVYANGKIGFFKGFWKKSLMFTRAAFAFIKSKIQYKR